MNLKEGVRSGAPFHIGVLAVDLPADQMQDRCTGKSWDLAFVDLQHSP